MKKAFTLIELLVVISIVGLLASILLVAFSGVQARGRDGKRAAEQASIGKALEYRYSEKGEYSIITNWVSIEEDATFSTDMNEYLTEIPEDPLYGQTGEGGEPYSYQYKSTDDGQHYAIKIVYETKGIVIVYSSPEGEIALGDGEGEMSGSGTPGDPYIITNAIQLQGMRDDLSAYYELGQNINASDTVNWNGGDGFESVGSQAVPFAGNFDGKDYTISGLYINRPLENYVGLFGYSNGEIENIGLEGADITGKVFVGELIGANIGTITNSYTTGDVTGTDLAVGGLVGMNWIGTITNSYTTGNVNGYAQVGGLVGYNMGSVSNSYSTGNVIGTGYVGGLVGYNRGNGMVTNVYATGSVTGDDYIGGLIGSSEANKAITNAYASEGNITGNSNVGGLFGYNDSTTTNSYWNNNQSVCCGFGSCGGCTNEPDFTNFYSSSHDVYDTNAPVWDFSTPIWIEVSNNYPILSP